MIMLTRALRLRKALQAWFLENVDEQIKVLRVELHEWCHIEYIIRLVRPFAMISDKLGATSGPTIHLTQAVYMELQDHVHEEQLLLQNAKRSWKKKILRALQVVEVELDVYFTKDRGSKRKIYNVASVLNPEYKLALYDNPQSRHDPATYKDQFERYFKLEYESKAAALQTSPRRQTITSDQLARTAKRLKARRRVQASEVSRYLAEGRLAL